MLEYHKVMKYSNKGMYMINRHVCLFIRLICCMTSLSCENHASPNHQLFLSKNKTCFQVIPRGFKWGFFMKSTPLKKQKKQKTMVIIFSAIAFQCIYIQHQSVSTDHCHSSKSFIHRFHDFFETEDWFQHEENKKDQSW